MGDIGNQKTVYNTQTNTCETKIGMNLNLSDYSFVTTEIMNIANICCNGRLISVLEGGYGHTDDYTLDEHTDKQKHTNKQTQKQKFEKKVTRQTNSQTNNQIINETNEQTQSNTQTDTELITQQEYTPTGLPKHTIDSLMNRDVLSSCAVAHLKRLIDPYPPSDIHP